MDWLINTEPGRIVILLATLIAIDIAAKRFLSVLIRRALKTHHFESPDAEKKREDTLIGILRTSIRIVLWAIGIIATLAILHINIVGLVTGAGIVGLAVGIGGQNAIKDFVAGVFILTENQYRVGDIITLGPVSGVVESITLRITKLRDLDGQLHIIPNGSIDIVSNHTFAWSGISLDIGVSYDTDLDSAKSIINKVGESLANDKDWKDMIMEPVEFLRVNEFADSSINIKCLGKVTPGTQWAVAGEFRSRLKKAFDKAGIEIPFPQRVIHQPKTNKK